MAFLATQERPDRADVAAMAVGLLDEFDRYASSPPTAYNDSPFMRRVREFLGEFR